MPLPDRTRLFDPSRPDAVGKIYALRAVLRLPTSVIDPKPTSTSFVRRMSVFSKVAGKHLKDPLTWYMRIYNQHIPQQALGHLAPSVALKQWHRDHPQLFVKAPRNLPNRR